MLTIYGVYRSRALRPLWVLAECGAPFTHVPVIQAYRLTDPAAQGAPLNTAMAEYRAINPLGQVPACRDGSLVLTESLAICLHIARKYGGTLGPASDDETATMENWALLAATAIEPFSIRILQTMGVGRAGTAEGQATMRAAADGMARPLAHLDAHLAGRDWLMDRFSVADICVAECVRYGQAHPVLAAHPLVASWLARCQARPAFQAMWAGRLAEPA